MLSQLLFKINFLYIFLMYYFLMKFIKTFTPCLFLPIDYPSSLHVYLFIILFIFLISFDVSLFQLPFWPIRLLNFWTHLLNLIEFFVLNHMALSIHLFTLLFQSYVKEDEFVYIQKMLPLFILIGSFELNYLIWY